MPQAQTARIRMLGNHWDYEFDHEYDLEIDIANNLTGMGMAVLVAHAEQVEAAPNNSQPETSADIPSDPPAAE